MKRPVPALPIEEVAMQLIPCPFCGTRSEAEFHFGGDLGNVRPEGSAEHADRDWPDYLYFRNNTRGPTSEIWMHMMCGEIFRLDRNTVDHQILRSSFLDGADNQ
jgi:sarcosine oxidase, subunit delta